MQQPRFHRWTWLGLLFAVHFVCNVAYLVIADPWDVHSRVLRSQWMYVLVPNVLVPISTSQPVLLAMWAIFGRQRPAHRAVLTVSSLAVLLVGPWALLRVQSSYFVGSIMLQYFAYQAGYFALSGALFLLIRPSLAWEIVAQRKWEVALSQPRRAKLALRDLLGLMALIGIALAAARTYESQYLMPILSHLALDGWYAAVALSLVPFCLAVDRAGTLKWPAFVVALAIGVHAVQVVIGPGVFSYAWGWWLAFLGGLLGSVAVSLALVREAGYRLVRAARHMPGVQSQQSPGEAGD